MDNLNRRIAELRGWTNLAQIDGSHYAGTPPDCPPEDRRLIPNWLKDWTETGPLLDELVMGIKPLDDINLGHEINWHDGGKVIHVDIPIGTSYAGHYAEGDTLQRAICKAWVAWKGAQK